MQGYLTSPQAAKFLSLSRAAITKALREGRLRGQKVGPRAWMIQKSDLNAFKYERAYKKLHGYTKSFTVKKHGPKVRGFNKDVDIDMNLQTGDR